MLKPHIFKSYNDLNPWGISSPWGNERSPELCIPSHISTRDKKLETSVVDVSASLTQELGKYVAPEYIIHAL